MSCILFNPSKATLLETHHAKNLQNGIKWLSRVCLVERHSATCWSFDRNGVISVYFYGIECHGRRYPIETSIIECHEGIRLKRLLLYGMKVSDWNVYYCMAWRYQIETSNIECHEDVRLKRLILNAMRVSDWNCYYCSGKEFFINVIKFNVFSQFKISNEALSK